MNIETLENPSSAAKYVAQKLCDVITHNNQAVIGFPTGRTMDAVYFHLANLFRDQKFDCSNVKAFLIDEYIGLVEGDKNLFYEYLNFHLFENLNFAKENIYTPNVFTDDYDQSAQSIENKLEEFGGLDFTLLGIGTNGHIGFNEPGSSIDSRTRVVALTSSTLNANKSVFKEKPFVPNTAITLGLGTMLESKEIMMLATGESKSDIILRLQNSEVSSKLPASVLKTHSNFTLVKGGI